MGLFSSRVTDPKAARRAAIAKTKLPIAFTLDKPLKSLAVWRPTVLPKTLLRCEVWAFTLLHTALFTVKRVLQNENYVVTEDSPASVRLAADVLYGLQHYVNLSFSSIAIASGFMSLLLVFFNSQCYARCISFSPDHHPHAHPRPHPRPNSGTCPSSTHAWRWAAPCKR